MIVVPEDELVRLPSKASESEEPLKVMFILLHLEASTHEVYRLRNRIHLHPIPLDLTKLHPVQNDNANYRWISNHPTSLVCSVPMAL